MFYTKKDVNPVAMPNFDKSMRIDAQPNFTSDPALVVANFSRVFLSEWKSITAFHLIIVMSQSPRRLNFTSTLAGETGLNNETTIIRPPNACALIIQLCHLDSNNLLSAASQVPSTYLK